MINQFLSFLNIFSIDFARWKSKRLPHITRWSHSGVFIVNFEYIWHFFTVSIADFEQVNVSWVYRDSLTLTQSNMETIFQIAEVNDKRLKVAPPPKKKKAFTKTMYNY